MTLLISGLGKLYFFMPSNVLAVDSEVAVRMLLFLAVAGVICWIGGRFHAAEQGLSTVLTSIADAVIATDERGRIKFMNPAAEALSGHGCGARLAGRAWADSSKGRESRPDAGGPASKD